MLPAYDICVSFVGIGDPASEFIPTSEYMSDLNFFFLAWLYGIAKHDGYLPIVIYSRDNNVHVAWPKQKAFSFLLLQPHTSRKKMAAAHSFSNEK